MIKLNNKNITYVALADSSNSLKAPKEIWYADSNNSVKLVYKRKDALIEGEDYEKYHWLQGRNGAYINTNHKLVTIEDRFDIKYHILDDGISGISNEIDLFGYTDKAFPNARNVIFTCFTAGRTYANYCYATNSSGYFFEGLLDGTMQLYADTSNMHLIINGVEQLVASTNGLTQQQMGDVYLFDVNLDSRGNHPFNGDIAYFKITNTSSNTKMDLIPCKLLKPVPKWLDANGIRRQVGECGMIDLVSGKFYGNVNSVGTFTVENYYERKEWLISEINARATMMQFGVGKSFSFKRKWFRGINAGYLYAAGYSYYINTEVLSSFLLYIWQESSSSIIYKLPTLSSSYEDGIVVESTPSSLMFNNNEVPFYGENGYNFLITSQDPTGMKCATSAITVDEVERYIPCTLTMDLPASMDANNIARTKGTSGMWDLVSDKFYGNVANSGTFKAVNLAEGVDYEVYDWLVGDGTAYISGITYNLWDNHLVSQVYNMNKSYRQFVQSDINLNDRNISMTRNSIYLQIIFRESSQTNITHIADLNPNDFSGAIDFDYYISDSNFNVKVNGVTYTNATSVYATESKWNSFDGLLIYSEKMSYIREITPSGIYASNLIPVKLLRSIPAKYDANGRARQAGECGMYDTVNDAFYGNVASSGSFTVEDDN